VQRIAVAAKLLNQHVTVIQNVGEKDQIQLGPNMLQKKTFDVTLGNDVKSISL
jgi:hypothetical protein